MTYETNTQDKKMTSLRDQFAMAAMQGILANGASNSAEVRAQSAYSQADAMMDERGLSDSDGAPKTAHENTGAHAYLDVFGVPRMNDDGTTMELVARIAMLATSLQGVNNAKFGD